MSDSRPPHRLPHPDRLARSGSITGPLARRPTAYDRHVRQVLADARRFDRPALVLLAAVLWAILIYLGLLIT